MTRGLRCMCLLGAAALLTSCGGSSSGTGTTTSEPRAGQTLSIMGFGTNGDDVAMTRFHLAQKAIAPAKVSAPNGGFNMQQFLTQLAANTPPDLIYVDRSQIGTLAATGAIEPLGSCVKSAGIDLSQIRKPALADVTYKGQVYGIPEFYDNRTLLVNEAIVPKPMSTTNWTTLKQQAKTFARTSGGKVSRIGFDPKLPEFFPLWVKANGGSILSADGKKAELNSPQNVQALTFADSLIAEQGGWNSFSSFRNTWNFFGSNNQIAKNELGEFPMEDWYYATLASVSPQVKVEAVPFTDRKGNPIDYETGSAWAILAKAKHPQLACTWAKTMTETSTWVAAANNRKRIYAQKHEYWTGLFTANAVADAKIDQPTKGEPAQWANILTTILNVQKHAFGIPASGASAEVATAWTNAVNQVLQGQSSPKSALDSAQSQAQSAIDSAGS